MNRNALVLLGAIVGLTVVGGLVLAGAGGSPEPSALSGSPDPGSSRTPSAGTPSVDASAGAPSPSAAPSYDGFLLPNMRSLPARNLRVQRTDDGRLLRFSAHLANYGPGPLLLRPRHRAAGCPARQHPAVQRLHRDGNTDGRYQRRRDPVGGPARDVGCMVRHRGHDHWHFDAMARYTLRDAGTGERVAATDKVSFCLRDNRPAPDAPVVVRQEYFGDCTRRSRQGISPGWVDVYKFDLPGQTLRLPRGLAGRLLCLELEADPLRVLAETDETDNRSVIDLRVRGTDVRRAETSRC